MITITISNRYERTYTKALRDNSISFLYEIDGENTILTVNEKDFQTAMKILDDIR
jgi:hypothetical protein